MSELLAKSITSGEWRRRGSGVEAQAFDGSWKWLMPTVHGGNPAEANANRDAIAAIPEMLAALRAVAMSPNCVCTGEHNITCDCIGNIVRDAIAKAEGR